MATAFTGFPRIDIVDVPGKGKGVIALEHISRGTLIISEKPRITLPVMPSGFPDPAALSALTPDDRAFLLSFPCPFHEDPILGRMKHFTPAGEATFGLCATICRVNHTCCSPKSRPNAAYAWNNRTKQEDLYAIEQICAGQEIEVCYLGVAEPTDFRIQLRNKFGFECSCPGCSRPEEERRASEERRRGYNNFISSFAFRFHLNPLQILNDIEKHVRIICEEGYRSEAGMRADDAFELCASFGDAASARQWEMIYRDSCALYKGIHSEAFTQAQKFVKRPQDYSRWGALRSMKLRGPSKEFLEYCYPRIIPHNNSAPNSASEPVASRSPVSPSAPLSPVPSESTAASAPPKLTKGHLLAAAFFALALAFLLKAAANQAEESSK
ncbi:hypothetical protein C8R43DRAFT_926195 [Mycena crocata]|nr:hypothetical protein C8R43DRAFT_926195 [Mycena crocata]